MKKIPTIFIRNPENMKEVLNVKNPECLWVFNGEGDATRKYDGTCVKIEHGIYLKRREVKNGNQIPVGFIEEDFDKITGKRVGWINIDPCLPENTWHMDAYTVGLPDGTYELIGPKIQNNPEKISCHVLQSHDNAIVLNNCPRNFDSLKEWIEPMDIEGIVFHHPDGRMAKIKKRDFGLRR